VKIRKIFYTQKMLPQKQTPKLPKLFSILTAITLITGVAVTPVVFNAAVIHAEAADNLTLPAPDNFSIDLYDTSDVILLWNENSESGIEEYIVFRTDTAAAPKEIARVSAGSTSYIDTTTEVGKTYTYRVQTYAKGKFGSDSETKSIVVTGKETVVSLPVVDGVVKLPEIAGSSVLLQNFKAWLGGLSSENFMIFIVGVNLGLILLMAAIYFTVRDKIKSKTAEDKFNLKHEKEILGGNTKRTLRQSMNNQAKKSSDSLENLHTPIMQKLRNDSKDTATNNGGVVRVQKPNSVAAAPVKPRNSVIIPVGMTSKDNFRNAELEADLEDLTVDLKNGKPDKNIVAAATEKYFDAKAKKIREWGIEVNDNPKE